MEQNELLKHIELMLQNRWDKTDSRFELMLKDLNYIKEQTTKTNGRVSVIEAKIELLEKESDSHYHNCPLNQRMKDVEETLLKRRSIQNWIVKAIAVISGAIALIFLIDKLLKYW